jgi:hypothetical protein
MSRTLRPLVALAMLVVIVAGCSNAPPGNGSSNRSRLADRCEVLPPTCDGAQPASFVAYQHTFATFALRAGSSTFDLSRYMGASLTMIDRHYGHLAAADGCGFKGAT